MYLNGKCGYGRRPKFSFSCVCSISRYCYRMFWLDALFLSCFLAFLFTLESYKSFHEHPISFNVETDYLHWNTTFPALTVCEVLDDDEQEKFYAQAEK